MKKSDFWFIATILSVSGCYAEWDIPVTPRKDPCSKQIQKQYVYVNPVCRYPAPATVVPARSSLTNLL